jgi:hypothetical protein
MRKNFVPSLSLSLSATLFMPNNRLAVIATAPTAAIKILAITGSVLQ